MKKFAAYQGNVVEVPASYTAEQVKALLAMTYTEVANATVSEETMQNGDVYYNFTTQSGTKG